jgi:Cu(I)/Ag(I) efflux system periplasmic protein CusF
MKSLKPMLLLAATLAFTNGAQAQTAAGTAAAAAKAQAPAEFTAAEVRKVDKDAGKITLKHEEIKNLGMPPMAMVFQVKDTAMLDKYTVGDKVQFKAVYDAGKYVVVEIRPAG